MPPQASTSHSQAAATAGPSSASPSSHSSPAALRHLVLDYLTHAGYKGTALALARDGARGDDEVQALQMGMAAKSGDSAMAPPLSQGAADKDEDEEMDGAGAAAESKGNGNGKASSATEGMSVGELSAREIEQMGWRSGESRFHSRGGGERSGGSA